MAIRQTEPRFFDIPTNLQVHPVRNDLLRLVDIEAIKRSVRNIVLTNPGERKFNPNFGVGLRNYLFENFTRDTAYIIEEKTREQLRLHEPRCRLIRILINQRDDENTLTVDILFSIINNPEPIRLELILTRVR